MVATTTATTPRLRPHRNAIVSILRFITITIITINTAGIAAAAGSAYWLSESSQASFAAAIEAQSQTASSPVLQQLTDKTLEDYDRSRRFDSAQSICEVTTLFIVVAAFTSILPFVLRLLMLIAAQARPSQQDIALAHIAAESQAAADDASKRLRRRLLTTFIVLQLTFVLRWVHSVIETYGYTPARPPLFIRSPPITCHLSSLPYSPLLSLSNSQPQLRLLTSLRQLPRQPVPSLPAPARTPLLLATLHPRILSFHPRARLPPCAAGCTVGHAQLARPQNSVRRLSLCQHPGWIPARANSQVVGQC